jgi:WD40 repeat protein
MLTVGGETRVTCLAYSPDGKTLAVGDGPMRPICTFLGRPPINENGGLIRLLDADTNRVRATLRPEKLRNHEYGVDQIVFSRDGSRLVSRGWEEVYPDGKDPEPSFFATLAIWSAIDGRGRERVRLVLPAEGLRLVTAISPDGRWMAAISGEHAVRLWDARTGVERDTIQIVDEPGNKVSRITALEFSPDGRILGAGGSECDVRLWDVETGRKIVRFEGHRRGDKRYQIGKLSFSRDSATLAAEGSFLQKVGDEWKMVSEITLYDLTTQREITVLPGQKDEIFFSMTFFPDGASLATGSHDGSVRIWEVATGKQRVVYKKQSAWVLRLAFSPDGRTLAAGDQRDIALWDTKTGERRADLLGHFLNVESLAFSPDRKTLASAGGGLMVWDLRAALKPEPDEGHLYEVNAVAFSPDSQTLASASEDRTIKLWDLAKKRPRATLRGHDQSILCLAYAPDGASLASGDSSGAVKIWNAVNGNSVAAFRAHMELVMSLNFSPDGKTIATGSGWSDFETKYGEVKLWDAATGEPRKSPARMASFVKAVTFSPDGKTLAIGSDDGSTTLLDVTTGQSFATLVAKNEGFFSEGILSLAYSPDGRRLAAGSADHSVKLWDVSRRDARLEGQLKHDEFVVSLSFSPDGKCLAACDRENTLKVWDVVNRVEVASTKSATDWFQSVKCSPDGKWLAAGNRDATIQVWDLGRVLATRQFRW